MFGVQNLSRTSSPCALQLFYKRVFPISEIYNKNEFKLYSIEATAELELNELNITNCF